MISPMNSQRSGIGVVAYAGHVYAVSARTNSEPNRLQWLKLLLPLHQEPPRDATQKPLETTRAQRPSSRHVNAEGEPSDLNSCWISLLLLMKDRGPMTSTRARQERLMWLCLPRMPCTLVHFLLLRRSPVCSPLTSAFEPSQEWGLVGGAEFAFLGSRQSSVDEAGLVWMLEHFKCIGGVHKISLKVLLYLKSS